MRKLQILGTGCTKCRQLAEATRAAADQLGLDYELEKVTDIDRIVAFGALMTPALAVDGQVRLAGRVPPVDEIKALLA